MLAILLAAAAAAAADAPLIAVLELNNRLPEAERASLDRGYFSDRIRQEALRKNPRLRLITRDNIETIAKAAGLDLAQCEDQCVVETGRKLGADMIVTGDLTKVGANYKVSLRLHDTAKAQLLALGQAGGATIEALDHNYGQAIAEVLQPLRPGARIEPEERRSFLSWMFFRDSAMVFGHGSTGGLGVALRALGVEGRWETRSYSEYATATENFQAKDKGFAVGISPLSLGNDREGDRTLSITFLQPFALLRFGSRDDRLASSGSVVSYSYSGFFVGARAGLGLRISGPLALRGGLELGLASTGYDAIAAGGPVPAVRDASNFHIGGYLGLGMDWPSP